VQLRQCSLKGVANALSTGCGTNEQEGKTALELARDEDTVQCFVEAGIKLSDIVTEEVRVACFLCQMSL
jgi:hypothetical protein